MHTSKELVRILAKKQPPPKNPKQNSKCESIDVFFLEKKIFTRDQQEGSRTRVSPSSAVCSVSWILMLTWCSQVGKENLSALCHVPSPAASSSVCLPEPEPQARAATCEDPSRPLWVPGEGGEGVNSPVGGSLPLPLFFSSWE